MRHFYFLSYLCLLQILQNSSGQKCGVLPWKRGIWIEREREVEFTESELDSMGECIDRQGDLMLLRSETNRGQCYRCAVEIPGDENVLRFKITRCHFLSDASLSVCSELPLASSRIHIFFKKNAPSIRCPLEMPLNFTYQTNFGACRSRISKATNCAQQNRLIFDLKACPEVPNKEETRIELECIGKWKVAGLTTMAVRMSGVNGIEHRCYLLESKGTTGRIGISADSTCEELTSIEAATNQIAYKMDTPILRQCNFPSFFLTHHKNKRKGIWESTTTGRKQVIRRGMWISSYEGKNDTVMQCLEDQSDDKNTDDSTTKILRVYTAKGCETGFQCVKLKRYSKRLIGVEFGAISSREYEECSNFFVEESDTLVSMDGTESCPISGKYINNDCDMIAIGCENATSVQMRQHCNDLNFDNWSCIGSHNDSDSLIMTIRNDENRRVSCMLISPNNTILLYDDVACTLSSSKKNNQPVWSLNYTSIEACQASSLFAGFLYSSTAKINFNLPILIIILKFLF